MHMDKIYREIFPMPELVIDIEYNRMDTGIKPKYPGSEDKKKRWTAPDIVLHKSEILCVPWEWGTESPSRLPGTKNHEREF